MAGKTLITRVGGCGGITPERACPIEKIVFESGVPSGRGWGWCGEYSFQAECVNEVNEAGTHDLSHRACHGPGTHKVYNQRVPTQSQSSMSFAQPTEKQVIHGETTCQQREIIKRCGI